MRILHTSDWHVGRSIRGRSRGGEHEAVLAEIAAVAADQHVDAVLVVGDLFDSAAPTPESERIVYRALLALAATGAAVLVVGGNHDSERRLQAVAPLLELGRITVQSMVAPADQGGVAAVTSRDGTEQALVAMVPFLSQRHVVRADELMRRDADEHATAYAERMRRVIGALTAGFGAGTVNVVAAHAMCHGGVLGGGERTAHTVFDYSIPGTAFPASAHYVALGHLHRHQAIAGPCPIRYCGSPLQLDFGEADDRKAVVVVEAHPGRPAEVHTVPLHAGRRLRTVRGTLADLRSLAGATGDDHLRVVVLEQPRIGLADEVRALLPEAVDVRIEAPAAGRPAPLPQPRLGRAPEDQFAEYLRERGALDERVLQLFGDLYEEASHDAPAPA